jgi:predicted Rossmann fold nucleotide-binding protein DprA/Smf involved in DNA uptake
LSVYIYGVNSNGTADVPSKTYLIGGKMADTVKLLKNIAADLKTISKEINAIATQVGKVTKPQAKATAKTKRVMKAVKAKTPKKSTTKTTAPSAKGSSSIVDSVLEVIRNAGDGISHVAILEKTGFGQRQVSNAVFKLKKQGKVKNVGRGVYAIA